ncbi:hypothetical protein KAH43_06385, partial [Candidatus Bipolaricaulota bacterium]|nr:hypothetical protein [Candidatus Bipolaricaulota bacterium]
MGRRAWIIAVAGLLCLVSLTASALPDLIVAEINIEPSQPQAGDSVFIEVTVANSGPDEVDKPFFVHFFMDGREIAVQSIVGNVAAGGSRRVATEWLALAGLHSLSVEIDPPIGRIDEANDANNSETRIISVALSAETAAAIGSLKVVVAPFSNLSGSGFLHVGSGVSTKLSDRFLGMGIRVLDSTDLESIMQERGLNPFLTADTALAAQILGADILITGSVTSLDMFEASLQLGFLSISSAEVNIRLSASLVDVHSSQVVGFVPAEGHAEGATGFSFDLTGLLGMVEEESEDLCGGGLQTPRSWYNIGELVPIAYRNPGTPKWLSIEIAASSGSFVRWLGWQYVSTNDCSVWNWDQLNTSQFQMSPGVYTAKLWNGTAYVAQLSFQIRPGISLSVLPATEITVGTAEFEDTVVGNALNLAVDDLATGLLGAIEAASPALAEQQFSAATGP